MNFRNLKIVKKLRGLAPRFRWLTFFDIHDLKINSRYIDFLIQDEGKEPGYDNKKLESMVRETLVREFSPEITKNKSYDLLVDAVVHNLKKQQLGEDAKVEID